MYLYTTYAGRAFGSFVVFASLAASFTAEARTRMQELAIYWSDKEDLKQLLDLAGFRQLPELGE